MSNINKIILGNFLIEEGSFKNWKFINILIHNGSYNDLFFTFNR